MVHANLDRCGKPVDRLHRLTPPRHAISTACRADRPVDPSSIHKRAHLRLLDLEPLVHEAERVLSAALIIIGEEPR